MSYFVSNLTEAITIVKKNVAVIVIVVVIVIVALPWDALLQTKKIIQIRRNDSKVYFLKVVC